MSGCGALAVASTVTVMSDVAALIAQPGDPDLDIDVDGVTLTAVVREGPHLLVAGSGGYGAWVGVDGEPAVFAPGDESSKITELNLNGYFPNSDEEFLAEFSARLEQWRDQQVPVRICGAPGRMTTLIVDRDNWLPFPRRALPDDVAPGEPR